MELEHWEFVRGGITDFEAKQGLSLFFGVSTNECDAPCKNILALFYSVSQSIIYILGARSRRYKTSSRMIVEKSINSGPNSQNTSGTRK